MLWYVSFQCKSDRFTDKYPGPVNRCFDHGLTLSCNRQDEKQGDSGYSGFIKKNILHLIKIHGLYQRISGHLLRLRKKRFNTLT